MSSRPQRISTFHDTLAWITQDKDLSVSIVLAQKNTKIYWEDEYPSFDRDKTYETEITVSTHRSYEAAQKLRFSAPESKIAILNFANSTNPGGGVRRGCTAQEECLCRTSTLYPVLNQQSLKKTFYKHHKTLNTSRASDALIYTEGIVVCKTDEDLPQRLPKEKWVTIDVITVAAPDLRKWTNITVALAGKKIDMSEAEQFECHVKRATHILTCAAAKGADTLVLGAFGCGDFGNEPDAVARAYKTALDAFPKVFKRIEFAIYCSPKNDKNYQVFKKTFE